MLLKMEFQLNFVGPILGWASKMFTHRRPKDTLSVLRPLETTERRATEEMGNTRKCILHVYIARSLA